MWQTESVVPHSAKQFGEIEKHNEQIRNADILHKSILEKGADASIKQIELAKEQNRLLSENYDKLKDLYNMQFQATEEAKEELCRSQKYNMWMMLISVVSMLAAIVSIIVSIFAL